MSQRTHGRHILVAMLLAISPAASPAFAKRTQAQLSATFKDRLIVRPDAPSCAVHFTDVVDERDSPEILGVIGRRGVLAPTDIPAWLHAVLLGLEARGIKPIMAGDGGASTSMPHAVFRLRIAWIDSTEVTYSANVSIRLSVGAAHGQSMDRDYRGRVSRTAYWSGGVDTLQSAIDGAFADALDDIAADLKPMCGGL